MKATFLLILFIAFGVHAQTTHDLNWGVGIGTNVNLTIVQGDIVRWTWTDAFPHTVESDAGSTEIFDSGTLTGIGETFSYQFNLVGTNPYYCLYHSLSMAGTITVESSLSVDEASIKNFSISPNPVTTTINLKSLKDIEIKSISIYNSLGQNVYSSNTIKNEIDVAHLNKGIYFLTLNSDKASHTKKFLKL